VRINGTLIWNRRYDVNSVTEAFAALTETRPSVGSPTGDIAVVGNWRSGAAPDQGYVLRVAGDSGLIGGGNTCAAIYGGPDTDRFTGVLESRFGATAGQLVFTGTSFSTAQANDIYLVRSQPNPCFSIAQRRIGNVGGAALGDEIPADIKQLAAPLAIGGAGDLILTGTVGKTGSNAYDALLLSASINTLIPFTGRLYGDHAVDRDQGASLFDLSTSAPPGVVIAGFSDSDFQAVGDPRDLYLLRTDAAGNTNCQVNLVPPNVAVAFPPAQLMPTATPFLQAVSRPVVIAGQLTPFQACP